MTREKLQIKEKVRNAIAKLKDNDKYLLQNDISEWAISHKLAVYLNDEFSGFDVDCEYNGYCEVDKGKKYIIALYEELEKLVKLKESDENKKFLERKVFPDIIIHKRGSNENLLILEIKKENNNDKDYDRLKLEKYTSSDGKNDLNYHLGAFIIFETGKEEMPHSIEWYKNGTKEKEVETNALSPAPPTND